jgi:OOP family OmpA-OmpF porin
LVIINFLSSHGIEMSNLKTTLLVSTLAAVISGAVPVFADGSNTYINSSVGRQDFANDRQLRAESITSIGLEHRFSNGWGAEIFWMDSLPSGPNNTGEIELTQYGIDGLYYFKRDESNLYDAIQPYGALGLGHADFKNTLITDDETQLRAGLGLRMIFSDHWSGKVDGRFIYNEEAGAVENTLSVGLSYAFNNQNKKIPPADADSDGASDADDLCPTTPPGVKVDSTGCALDRDGDGVPNDFDNCPDMPEVAVDSKGCALDSDNDGVVDYVVFANDVCPTTPTGVKADSAGCALDTDGDGVPDYLDNCPGRPSAGIAVDSEGCAFDSDNDAVADYKDSCRNSPAGVAVDAEGCVLDSDNDGYADYRDSCLATPAGRAVDSNGCKFVLTSSKEVPLKINFASNSTFVTQDNHSEIEKVANFLRKYGEVNTIIVGFADDRGTDAYNIYLSKVRAEAVMTVLIEHFGIEADRITAMGQGETRPVAPNDTKEGRLANRRVVAVMKAEGSE